MHLEAVCGVYLLEDLLSGRVYVGQSVDCYSRLSSHRNEMKCGNANPKLQEIYDAHGFSSLRFEVVEVCEFAERLDRESAWIHRFRPEDLLNLHIPGNFEDTVEFVTMGMVSDIIKMWSQYQAMPSELKGRRRLSA